MTKESEESKPMEEPDAIASETSESEQRHEPLNAVVEPMMQITGETALVEALERYAWRKLKYPPFSVTCVQEVVRWVRWAVSNNSLAGLADTDVRSDLVRILHEGCAQYCERVADELLSIGVRSVVDEPVVQFVMETTQIKDMYLVHRMLADCEIYNIGLLRNVLKSPPQLERLKQAIKSHTQKSDIWIDLTVKNMENALTQFAAALAGVANVAGVAALAARNPDAARLIPTMDADPEAIQRHLELSRAMMVRPFVDSESSHAVKRRRKGWTTEEEEYIRQCIKLYKMSHPDKKTKRAPNELVHFIRSQPGAHVLQDGHELDQNIKNKINDIYKKGFMYEA